MSVEIHRADPRLRRQAFVVLGAALLLAVVVVLLAHRWMDRSAHALSTTELVATMRLMIGAAMAGTVVCLLILAGYAAYLGRRVAEERRWPLASARVLRDTPVRSGAAAMGLGRMLIIAAVVLGALAIGAGVLSWQLLALL